MALSITDAEFVAANEGVRELIWQRRLFEGLSIKSDDVPTLYIDNASVVRLVKNPEFYRHSKHIEMRYCFVRECHLENRIKVEHMCVSNPGENGAF